MSPTSKRGNLGSELTRELIVAAPSDGAGYESVGEENGNLIMEEVVVEVVEELPELTPANRSAGVNQLEPDSLHHPMSAGVDESIGKGGCALLKERQDEAAGLIPGLNQLEHDSSPLPAAGAGESVGEERGNLDLEEAVETPVLIAASKSNNNWSNFDDIEDADDWSKNMEDAVPEEHLHESKVESTDFTPLPSEENEENAAELKFIAAAELKIDKGLGFEPAPSAPMSISINLRPGFRNGKSLQCKPSQPTRIGHVIRGNTLAIKDQGISQKRRLLEFLPNISHWAVTNLDTSSGTLINALPNLPPSPHRSRHHQDWGGHLHLHPHLRSRQADVLSPTRWHGRSAKEDAPDFKPETAIVAELIVGRSVRSGREIASEPPTQPSEEIEEAPRVT